MHQGCVAVIYSYFEETDEQVEVTLVRYTRLTPAHSCISATVASTNHWRLKS